jgi:FkbM family methyltransferase
MGRFRRLLGEVRALSAAPSVERQATLEMVHHRLLKGLGFGDDDPYRNGELRIARELLAAPSDRVSVVLDVGANRGNYAAMLLDDVGSNLDVHCFEPSPTAYAELAARFDGNPRVRLQNIGLGDVEGDVALHTNATGSGCASLHDRAVFGSSTSELVRVRRLDSVCSELGLSAIDFLKIDAEGHDLMVLRGAGTLLEERCIGAIQFEHGGTAPDARVFLRDFFDLLEPDYRIHRLLPDGLWPLQAYTEDLELSLYANYVALPVTA